MRSTAASSKVSLTGRLASHVPDALGDIPILVAARRMDFAGAVRRDCTADSPANADRRLPSGVYASGAIFRRVVGTYSCEAVWLSMAW